MAKYNPSSIHIIRACAIFHHRIHTSRRPMYCRSLDETMMLDPPHTNTQRECGPFFLRPVSWKHIKLPPPPIADLHLRIQS